MSFAVQPSAAASRRLKASNENAFPGGATKRTLRAGEHKLLANAAPAVAQSSLVSKPQSVAQRTRRALADVGGGHPQHGAAAPSSRAAVQFEDVHHAPAVRVGMPAAESCAMEIDDLDELLEESAHEQVLTSTAAAAATTTAAASLVAAVPSPRYADPQMADIYIADIMRNMMVKEIEYQPSAIYMSFQTDINARMREILVSWMVEVHHKFKLEQETLYLAVNYLDRVLSVRQVHRSQLQLVGCSCMLTASKYEEIYPPEVNDFVVMSARAFERHDMLEMENTVLKALGFRLTAPTALRFAERFCAVAELKGDDMSTCMYLLEATLQHYQFLAYRPSQLAAAAVYLTRILCRSDGQPQQPCYWDRWPGLLAHETRCTESEVAECAAAVLTQLRASEGSKYDAVTRKFGLPEWGRVARKLVLPESLPL